VNAELPASTVFGRIDLHSCRPCRAGSGLRSFCGCSPSLAMTIPARCSGVCPPLSRCAG
jgi:hypothetical protein